MRVLSFGSVGPAVALLQLALDRAGFGPLETDGVFGALTQGALARFQAVNGLRADAVAGQRTHQALRPWYTGYRLHTLKRGESLWTLGRLYNVDPARIALANPGLAPENLPVGAQLIVPLPFPVVPTTIDCFAELVGFCVQGLSARYPFLRSGQIGQSGMGRPLWSLTIGRGNNRVLYNAEHHANEWITSTLLLRFAEELAEAYAGGGRLFGRSAEELLDYATLCLIPAVNPDGMDLVVGELRGGERYEAALRIARSYPRFPFPAGWKADLRGVDLNLQYPAGWEEARANKYAQGIVSPAPADFVGDAPLSEAEAHAMYEFTLRFDPALVLAYHTQGEVIYWKYLDIEPPGAARIAAYFSSLSGYAAEETPYSAGFAGYKDWFIRAFDRPGFTVEAGRGVNPLPIADLDGICRRNLGILTEGMLVT